MRTSTLLSDRSTLRRGLRLALAAGAVALPLSAFMTSVAAQAPAGQAFQSLSGGYTQELVAATDVGSYPLSPTVARVLGGVAFAPDGDVWAADCLFQDTRLHRYDMQAHRPAVHGTSSLREESLTVATQGGCGLTNHPDGAMYSNSVQGVWKLDVNTGAAIAGPLGQPGNALGITVDPISQHVVYVGIDCHDQLVPSATTCTLWDLNPADGSTTPFAMFPRSEVPFVDGIYFDPSGNYLFVTNRSEREVIASEGEYELNALTIVSRPTAPVTAASSAQIVRHLPTFSEPDGVAFHSVDHFVVTNDETNGTMTRFDFPSGDFSQEPSGFSSLHPVDGNGDPVGDPIRVYGTPFALGGHRGDLLQVGADGCIYATQGRNFLVTDAGTRYDDLTETSEDSIVRICSTTPGGFEPPPGVGRDSTTGRIAGSAYFDVNGNHTIDAADSFLGGVSIGLSGAATQSATTTAGPAPAYAFADLAAGSYTVTAPSAFDGYALSTSTAATRTATITVAGEAITDIDFLYEAGSLAGSVYLDTNDNAAIDAGDVFLAGVPVSLTGMSSGSSTSGSGPVPTYAFPSLKAGSYSVAVPANFSGYQAQAVAQSRTLAAGASVTGVDFLYVRGSLSGFAYVDANRNHQKDSGEAPLANVAIQVAGHPVVLTAADGSYSVRGLAANSYTISAPATASGYALGTASPLSATVTAGGSSTGNNFGYVPGGISGFAYLDYNRNGVKDAGEPGLSGVSIALTGGGTAVTGATGAYAFNSLTAGVQTVTAPTSASGFTLGTANPLSATLAAGGSVPNLNFGYRDTIAPVCAVYGTANPPYMTYRDTGSGIVRLDVTKNLNTNFRVTMTPAPSAFVPATVLNATAMPTGMFATYATPTTSLITVTAQRLNTAVSAQLIVVATDAFGNTVTCDPVETTVTRLRHDRGIQTFTDLPFDEHFVTIENGTPGLRGLDILVNGVEFRVRGLSDGEVKRVNVRRAMMPGTTNTITLIPRGRPGESADITIAERQ